MPKEVPETKQGPILGGGKSGNLIGKLRDEHTEALKEYTVLEMRVWTKHRRIFSRIWLDGSMCSTQIGTCCMVEVSEDENARPETDKNTKACHAR